MSLEDLNDTPTPGQIAYEAWFLALENTLPAGSARWPELEARLREAWETAAQAVLEHRPNVEYATGV